MIRLMIFVTFCFITNGRQQSCDKKSDIQNYTYVDWSLLRNFYISFLERISNLYLELNDFFPAFDQLSIYLSL